MNDFESARRAEKVERMLNLLHARRTFSGRRLTAELIRMTPADRLRLDTKANGHRSASPDTWEALHRECERIDAGTQEQVEAALGRVG